LGVQMTDCKLGIMNGKCFDDDKKCRFFKGHTYADNCSLLELLNDVYMEGRTISCRNLFLSDILHKD